MTDITVSSISPEVAAPTTSGLGIGSRTGISLDVVPTMASTSTAVAATPTSDTGSQISEDVVAIDDDWKHQIARRKR